MILINWLRNTPIAFIATKIPLLIYVMAMWLVCCLAYFYIYFLWAQRNDVIIFLLWNLRCSFNWYVVFFFIHSFWNWLFFYIAWHFISKFAKSYNSSVAYTIWRHITHFIWNWIARRQYRRWHIAGGYQKKTSNAWRWTWRSQAFRAHQTIHYIWFQSKNSTCAIYWNGYFCGSRSFSSHGQKLSEKHWGQSHSICHGDDQWCSVALSSSVARSSNQFHTEAVRDLAQWSKGIAALQWYWYLFE